jgi:hypothetical protein
MISATNSAPLMSRHLFASMLHSSSAERKADQRRAKSVEHKLVHLRFRSALVCGVPCSAYLRHDFSHQFGALAVQEGVTNGHVVQHLCAVLRECYKGVTGVLLECYKSVVIVLQGSRAQ